MPSSPSPVHRAGRQDHQNLPRHRCRHQPPGRGTMQPAPCTGSSGLCGWAWGAAGMGTDWGQVPADTELPPPQKERDLELAARIGQSLLKQNRSLTERNELLEEQLELAKEEVPAPGHSPWARSTALAPLRPRPCPDVPSPPPRSRSCATRSPCGTICSTSTPPPRRRASPPRPPPRREWVPAPLPTPWGFFGVGGWRNWVWGPADGVGG